MRPAVQYADLTRRAIAAADGVRISSVVSTPPAGAPVAAGLPPILAVHGYASSAAGGWGRTGHLERLARAGRVVLAVDLRGHGESGKPHDAAAYALDRVLADIADVASALPSWLAGSRFETVAARRDFDVIGYSLGSRLGWSLVWRRMLPIRRMVLGGFDGRPLFSGVDPRKLDQLAAWSNRNDREALAQLVAGLKGTGLSPDGSVPPDIPVLIVAGDEDPLGSGAADFAASLPRGEFLSVPGRNHISAVPAKVYREGLVEFLARPDSSERAATSVADSASRPIG